MSITNGLKSHPTWSNFNSLINAPEAESTLKADSKDLVWWTLDEILQNAAVSSAAAR